MQNIIIYMDYIILFKFNVMHKCLIFNVKI